MQDEIRFFFYVPALYQVKPGVSCTWAKYAAGIHFTVQLESFVSCADKLNEDDGCVDGRVPWKNKSQCKLFSQIYSSFVADFCKVKIKIDYPFHQQPYDFIYLNLCPWQIKV